MNGRRRTGSTVLGIVVLSGSSLLLGVRGPVSGQEISQQAKEALEQRDRLRTETQKLRGQGKVPEAIAAAEAMLAIERKVLTADHPDLAASLEWLARLHLAREDFAAAKEARTEALEILRKRYGATHWKVTDARLALEQVDRVQAMTPEKRRKAAEGDRLNGEVIALFRAGRYREALELARREVALDKELLGEHQPDYATSLVNLAGLLDSLGHAVAATPLYEQALKIRKAALGERHPDYAQSLNALAEVLRSQRNYGAARPLYEKALAIIKEVAGKRHPDYATTLNNLALLLYAQGNYAAAEPLYQEALAIIKEVRGARHPDYATTLNNLGSLLYARGDYAAARLVYEKALAIRKEVLGQRHPDYARSLNNLAALLDAQGDHASAKALDYEALAIRKEMLGERHPDYANSLNNLARLLANQGDYAAATPLAEQARAIRKDVLGERHRDYATSLNDLAMLLNSQGDYAAARPLAGQALAIRKDVLGEQHPDYADSLNSLANLLQAQRDYAGATRLYEKALAVRKAALGERHPDYAISLNNLALLRKLQGDYAAARRLYDQALARNRDLLGDHHRVYATSLSNLASLLWAQRDYAGAASLLEQALEVEQSNFELSARTQSERQQLAMARDLRSGPDGYLSLAPMARLRPEDAYRHALAAKGAVFERQRRSHIRRQLPADPQSRAAARFAEYEQTVQQLASLALTIPDPRQATVWRARTAELSVRKDELEAELARLDADFRTSQAEARRTPEQIQAALPKETALVDLLVYIALRPSAEGRFGFEGERRVVAFVVRPDRPLARIDLGPIRPIVQAIDAWRALLVSAKSAPAASDPACTLRRLLWEPLEPQLDGIKSVLISPDGPIGQVPMTALPGNKPNSYLIEERAIAVVPVPRMLDAVATAAAPSRGTKTAQSDRAPSLLLAGNIDYGGEPGKDTELAMRRSAALDSRAGRIAAFPHLEATREEIRAIRDSFERHFRAAHADVLCKDQATESAFRREAPRHRYLHLATHGYFAPPELRSALGPVEPKASSLEVDTLGGAGVAGWHPGLLSGIALAGASHWPTPPGQDDGILTALEVAELDLSGVELAVLSACETGLGEVAGGEGLLGLQRAFQVAGAHSVVASLWKVGDEPTRALMARFYENLWSQGQPPATALREAQLWMLRGGRREVVLDTPRGARQRGLEPVDKDQPEGPTDRLPPFYWAAFVLSTDRL
jgi:CHAT domain-containing protein/Tfp pilus assembly protein PilF